MNYLALIPVVGMLALGAAVWYYRREAKRNAQANQDLGVLLAAVQGTNKELTKERDTAMAKLAARHREEKARDDQEAASVNTAAGAASFLRDSLARGGSGNGSVPGK